MMETHAHLTEKSRPVATERFFDGELEEVMKGFAVRLREAFDGANDSEIARQCGTTQATVREYTGGRRLPIPEILLHISRRKGVSIDWLLTGRGTKWVAPANDLFDQEEELEIREMAQLAGRSFPEQVRELALAAVEIKKKI